MNILMVLTSHSKLGTTGQKTGFWLEEFAAPYYVFKDAGASITLASPLGGQPPLDPKSDDAASQTAATLRYKSDTATQSALAATVVDDELTDAAVHAAPDGTRFSGSLLGAPRAMTLALSELSEDASCV